MTEEEIIELQANSAIKKALEYSKPQGSKIAAESIMADCMDRCGIKSAFLEVPSEVINDIELVWIKIIEKCMESK